MRPTRAAQQLERAQAELESGHPEVALRRAWRIATAAASQRDDAMLRSLSALARQIHDHSDEAVAHEAARLIQFCEAAIDDNDVARQGLAPSRFRLWGSRRRIKSCPDCAETILLDANVCRYCGYRFAATPEGGDAARAE